MIFKPYPKYTSCAIQWFNEIPQSWKQVRVEQYLIKKDENIGDLWSSTQLLSLTQKGIIEKDINDGKGKTHSDYSTYQAIDIGDLVFCLFDIDETPRTVGLSTKKGMITSAYTAFKSKENINTQYVYYFFESLDDAKALKPYYKGLRKTVRPPEFLKIHVPFPPKVEQVAISQFLDTETTRIDNLIAKQEKLIELLEEQRKSIISHAVTKGLNPNAPMKDSGVEWLGDVPSHWDVKSLKFVAEINGRIGFRGYTTNDIVDEGNGAITLSPSNLNYKGLDLEKRTYLSWAKYFESPEIQVNRNDIVLVKTGSSLGKIGFCYFDVNGATINPQLVIIRSKSKYTINPKFLFFCLLMPYFKSKIVSSNKGGTMPTVTQESIGNINLPIPHISIQNEIVKYLDTENLKLDNLISKQQALIDKLKEYRASIISHAVTGKIDVREFGA